MAAIVSERLPHTATVRVVGRHTGHRSGNTRPRARPRTGQSNSGASKRVRLSSQKCGYDAKVTDASQSSPACSPRGMRESTGLQVRAAGADVRRAESRGSAEGGG